MFSHGVSCIEVVEADEVEFASVRELYNIPVDQHERNASFADPAANLIIKFVALRNAFQRCEKDPVDFLFDIFFATFLRQVAPDFRIARSRPIPDALEIPFCDRSMNRSLIVAKISDSPGPGNNSPNVVLWFIPW